MPSSYTAELGVEQQAAGEGLNAWGDPKLNNALMRLSKGIAGYVAIALTGDRTLTTSTSSTTAADFEAYQAMLKFTGTLSSATTVTIPSKAKQYLVWNATNVAVTMTTGAGATVAVPPTGKVVVFCDASGVYEAGYSGHGLKDYIDQAVLGATGSLPAIVGNTGKVVYCDGTSWLPHLLVMADISDLSLATAADVRTGTSTTKPTTPGALRDAQASQTLTDASTVAWNVSSGAAAELTMTSGVGSSRTLGAPSGCKVGDDILVRVLQPPSGGTYTYQLAYNAAWQWGDNGPPIATTGAAGAWCIVSGRVVAIDGSGNATKIAASFWGGGS